MFLADGEQRRTHFGAVLEYDDVGAHGVGHGEFPVDFAPLRSGGSFLLPEFLAGIGQFHFHDLVLFELGLVKLLLTDTPWRLGRSRKFLTGEKNHWNPNFSPMRKLAKELVVCQNYTNVSKIANTLL